MIFISIEFESKKDSGGYKRLLISRVDGDIDDLNRRREVAKSICIDICE